MRRTHLFVTAATLGLGAFLLAAQTKTPSEPVFGIQYDPKAVHFEKAPPLVGKTCKDLRGKNVFVYARTTDRDIEYFIVQEYLGEFGVAVAIQGEHCAEIDSDRFLYEGAGVFSDQGIVVTEADSRSVSDKIVADVLNRYEKAFGGKKEFLKSLGTNGDNLPKSPLRTKLEQYRATS